MNVIDLKSFAGFDEERIVDTSEKTRSYLITGKNGSQHRLSPSAYRLLQAIASGMSFGELARKVNESNRTAEISEEHLKKVYDDLTDKLSKAETVAGMRKTPFGFWLKLPLIPEKMVVRIASILAILYEPWIAGVLIFAATIMATVSCRHGFTLALDDHVWAAGYCLFLLLLVLHEFGHAAACIRYGAVPSNIGFTMYLIYPALYSDVSSCWQLKRIERVAVDLGGSYFQLLATGCLFLAFDITHWASVRFAITMSIYAALFSLNPIFKFDGYWVLADLLGVTNLGEQSVRVLRHFVRRAFGRPVEPLPWPGWVVCVLGVYSATALLIWGLFLRMLLPTAAHECDLLVHEMRTLSAYLAVGKTPALRDINSLFFSIIFNVISIVTLWYVGKQIVFGLIMNGHSIYKICMKKWSRSKTTAEQSIDAA